MEEIESSQNQKIRDTLQLINDGVLVNYCKASPGSKEWQDYQIQRLQSMKRLKVKGVEYERKTNIDEQALTKDITEEQPHLPDSIDSSSEEKPVVPPILKKNRRHDTNLENVRDANVKWKEPIADTRLLSRLLLNIPNVSNHDIDHEKTLAKGKSPTSITRNGRKDRLLRGIYNPVSKSVSSVNQLRSSVSSFGRNLAKAKIKRQKNSNKNITGKHTSSTTSGKENKGSSDLSNNNLEPENSIITPSKNLKKLLEEEDIPNMSASVSTAVARELSFEKQATDKKPKSFSKKAISSGRKNNKANIASRKGSSHNPGGLKESRRQGLQQQQQVVVNTKYQEENGTVHNVASFSQEIAKPTNIMASKTVSRVLSHSESNSPSKVHVAVADEDNNNTNRLGNKTGVIIDTRRQLAAESTSNKSSRSSFEKNKTTTATTGASLTEGSKPFKSRRKNVTLEYEELEKILTRIKPPELPEFGLCEALPGTPGWEKYWMEFNSQISQYYASVEKYSKLMDDLLVDEDGKSYTNQLRRRQLDETALRMSMGLAIPKPPLIRQPLNGTIEVGGYVIRSLGGVVAGAVITTYDHSSFRLEVPLERFDRELDNIAVDTVLKTLTITIPANANNVNELMKLIQISVPKYKRIENLEVSNPLYNGGKIVITGK